LTFNEAYDRVADFHLHSTVSWLLFVSAFAVCSTLSKGVFVIVGSVHRSALRAIDSFTRTFSIPYISISDPAADGILQRGSEEGSEYILHLVPGYHRTILDVAKHYHWTTVFYIYDSDEG